MERKHLEEYKYLYPHYSLFSWNQCSKCKKDFRREKIWKALTGPWLGNKGVERFLCTRCAPTRKEANKFFINEEFLSPKPPPPTSPPSKNYINH